MASFIVGDQDHHFNPVHRLRSLVQSHLLNLNKQPDVEGKCGKGHRQTRLLGLGVNRFFLLVQSLTEVFQQFVSRSLRRARCCVCSWQCDGEGK